MASNSDLSGSPPIVAPRQRHHQTFFQIAGQNCIAFPEGGSVEGVGQEIGRLEIEGRRYLVCQCRFLERGANGGVIERLTRRECEIALLIAAGMMNKQIAYQLRISCWTVGTYIRRIFAKLAVRNRAEMTALLIAELNSQRDSNDA